MELKRNRVSYTAAQKEAVVERMMPPQNESVPKLSKETGIIEVTLYIVCTPGAAYLIGSLV